MNEKDKFSFFDDEDDFSAPGKNEISEPPRKSKVQSGKASETIIEDDGSDQIFTDMSGARSRGAWKRFFRPDQKRREPKRAKAGAKESDSEIYSEKNILTESQIREIEQERRRKRDQKKETAKLLERVRKNLEQGGNGIENGFDDEEEPETMPEQATKEQPGENAPENTVPESTMPKSEKTASLEPEQEQKDAPVKKEKRVPKIIPMQEDIFEDLEEEPDEYEEDESSMFKVGITILVIILLCVAGTIVYQTDDGWIGEYKKNFSANMRAIDQKLHISETIDVIRGEEPETAGAAATPKPLDLGIQKETKMLPFENAAASQYSVTPQGIAVAKANYLVIYDKKGQIVWETTTSVVEPILKAEGDYIMLAEVGGRKICMYSGKKMLYAIETESNIQTADVSSNGDVAAVTKKEYYKGALEVFNREGNRIFSWSSGTDYIVSADISGTSRRVAAALINTDARVYSKLMLFDINEPESYYSQDFEGTALYNLEFVNETVNVAADNRISGISGRGKVLWDTVYNDAKFMRYACDAKGNKLVQLDENNIPQLVIYSRGGDEKEKLNAEEAPDFIDIQDSTILYNNSRITVFGRPGRLEKYAASMDIRGLKIIDKNNYLIVYNNSIEFVNN